MTDPQSTDPENTDASPDLADLELPHRDGEIRTFTHRNEEYAVRAQPDDTWDVGQRIDGDWSTVFEFAHRDGSYGVIGEEHGWKPQGSDWRRIIRDMV